MQRLGAAVLAAGLTFGASPALGDGFDVPAAPASGGLVLDRMFDTQAGTIGGLQLQVSGAASVVPPFGSASTPGAGAALPLNIPLLANPGPATMSVQSLRLNLAAALPFFATAPASWQSAKGITLPEFFGLGGTVADDGADVGPVAPEPVQLDAAAAPPAFSPGGLLARQAAGQRVTFSSPIRIGGMHLSGGLVAEHLEELEPNPGPPASFGEELPSNARATRDVLGGGAAFALPAFGKHVGISLTGGVEHVQRNDRTLAAYTPFDASVSALERSALSYQAQTGNGVYADDTPNFFDVYRVRMGAGATVPVSRDVVFGASYDTQQLHGTAGTTLVPNVAERKDQVDLSLTYNVPKTTGAVLFSFHNNVYRDLTESSLANFNFTQNREDLTFSVRF